MRLSELFNINHFIVSQVCCRCNPGFLNPLVLIARDKVDRTRLEEEARHANFRWHVSRSLSVLCRTGPATYRSVPVCNQIFLPITVFSLLLYTHLS